MAPETRLRSADEADVLPEPGRGLRLGPLNLDRGRLEQVPWPPVALAVAMVMSFAAILWLNRGMVLSPDELSWFLTSPGLTAKGALEPYGGHLILTSRGLYKVLFEVFGSGYLPFRVLAAATVLLTVGLFYVYASRAVGGVVALAPSIVLLFFGSDALHVLAGNTFTVLLPIACGTAALLLVDRDSRLGDAAVCALLCLAVATYSTGLAVVAGLAVAILLHRHRWRRVWVVAVPIVFYVAWYAWAHGHAANSGSAATASNVLLIPVWSFDALAAVVSALVGLRYQFDSAPTLIDAGPALALIVLGLLVVRLRRGPVAAGFWPPLAMVVGLWGLQTLASNGSENYPASSHYLLPGAVLVLMAAAQAARGVRWTPDRLLVLLVVAAVGLATNVTVLRQQAAKYRLIVAPQMSATLAALDVAGDQAPPRFTFGDSKAYQGVRLAFLGVSNQVAPTAAYREATRRYGTPATPVRDLGVFSPIITDSVLIAALPVRLTPAGDVTPHGCRAAAPSPDGKMTFSVRPGSVVLVTGARGDVVARRFSPLGSNPVGSVPSGEHVILTVPRDLAPDRPWHISAGGTRVRVCATR